MLAGLEAARAAAVPRPQQGRPGQEGQACWRLSAELSERLNPEQVFMISAATGDGVADLKPALAEAMPEGPWLYPRGPGVRRHRPDDRGRADPRADRQPAPPGAALCDGGRDREMGGPHGRLDRHPPADPGRARQPEGDRARQGRGAAQGIGAGGARGDRASISAGRSTCSCTSRSTRSWDEDRGLYREIGLEWAD